MILLLHYKLRNMIEKEDVDKLSNESKIAIVNIGDNLSIYFMYIPDGYGITEVNSETQKTQIIGKLKQFNKLKILKPQKLDNGDLVKLFTDVLIQKGQDFNKYPNPTAYAFWN